MSDAHGAPKPPRPGRRTLPVVILDATLAVGAALATGHPPWSRGARSADAPLPQPDPEESFGDHADARVDQARAPRRRAGAVWVTVAGVAVAAGTALLVVAFLRAPGGLAPLGSASPPAAAAMPPEAAATPAPSPTGDARLGMPVPASSGAGGGSSPPAATTSAPPPAPPVPLDARYESATGGTGLLGYRATVTITNPAATPASGWQLVVTLPRSSLRIADVSGASVRQDGRSWTFTPEPATATVPPGGGAVTVAFEVHGATLVAAAPTACAIDGNPCAGVE